MNRLQTSKASSFQLSSPFDSLLTFAKQPTTSTKVARGDAIGRHVSPLRSLRPAPLRARGYAYPLLIWLHDDGGSERELRQLMPHVSVRNYVAAAARGVGADASRHGYSWDHCPESACEASERMTECIDAAKHGSTFMPTASSSPVREAAARWPSA